MVRKHVKRLATLSPMVYRKLMVVKNTKANKLDELFGEMTVEEMDGALLELKRRYSRMYVIRQLKAQEDGITTPPPAPPFPDASRSDSDVFRKNARISPPSSPIQDLTLISGSAADVVFKIVERYPRGLTTPILRDEYEKTELAKTAVPGTKPYYYGLHRLKMSGHVVTYKGKVFLHQHLEKFKEDVAAGRVPDIIEVRKLNSKWSVGVIEYLRSREQELVTFKEICDHIAAQPTFKDHKNVEQKVAVALNNLNHKYEIIEKIKVKGQKPLYRIKPEISPSAETDETFWGAEADASTPRH